MAEDILQQLGQPGNTQPSEELDEIKVPDKKKSSKKPIDDEVLQSMMANGDNTKGMFEPDESAVKDKDEKLHEDQDKDVKLKTKGEATPSKKYEKEFQKDMIKNPENYYIDTPKGRMTIKEAQEKGYDPVTHRFREKQRDSAREEELLSQVNDQDRAGIEALMDPKNVGLAPADAEGMGLKPDSPMIAQQAPEGSIPPQAATPQGAALAGQPDISQLLGGNA